MSTAYWILGAGDPEMEMIERLLRESMQHVVYALHGGERVQPDTAYRADGLSESIPEGARVYRVECDGPAIPASAQVIDHHRPGDPGYGRPPAEFLSASSIGQVCSELGLAILYAHRDDACRALSDEEGGHGWHADWSGIGNILDSSGGVWSTVRPGAQPWLTGKYGLRPGVPLPEHAERLTVDALDVLLAAAADHCPDAARRGECPGVDPDALTLRLLAVPSKE